VLDGSGVDTDGFATTVCHVPRHSGACSTSSSSCSSADRKIESSRIKVCRQHCPDDSATRIPPILILDQRFLPSRASSSLKFSIAVAHKRSETFETVAISSWKTSSKYIYMPICTTGRSSRANLEQEARPVKGKVSIIQQVFSHQKVTMRMMTLRYQHSDCYIVMAVAISK